MVVPTLTKSELADLLKVHTKTVERLVQRGKLPKPKAVGRFQRWRWCDVQHLIGEVSDPVMPAAA